MKGRVCAEDRMMKKGAAYVLIFPAARPCTFARQCSLFERKEVLSSWARYSLMFCV